MGVLADRLQELAKAGGDPAAVPKAPWQVHEACLAYRAKAVNIAPFMPPPWCENPSNTARKLRANSMRLERSVARARGTYIVDKLIGAENFEYLKARELTKRVDGFGAVQFKVKKNPKKVTHIEVHQEPEGSFLVKALRFHKVRQVFEWIYEVEAERTVEPGEDIAVVFSTLTGVDMGMVYAYKLQPADPTVPCPQCGEIFGPRAPSHKVKGTNDRIFCSRECADAQAVPL